MAQKFPYTPTAGALVQLLGQLRKSFPATVDSAMLKRLGLAPNNESYNLSVIRFLGLIDEKGAKNPKHQSLFSIADHAKFSQEFSKVVHDAYGELFKLHGDESWELSKPTLSTFFRQSDGTSAVVGDRQVATFVALAEMSGKRSSTPKTPAQPNDGKKKGSTRAAETPAKTIRAKVDKSGPSNEPAIDGNGKTEFSRDVGISVKVEVILPSDASAETYENIFRSIRKNLIE